MEGETMKILGYRDGMVVQFAKREGTVQFGDRTILRFVSGSPGQLNAGDLIRLLIEGGEDGCFGVYVCGLTRIEYEHPRF